MKKKFPTKTFVVVTPLHSIRLRDSVVRVVPNAPRAKADLEPDQWSGVIVIGYRTYTCTKGLRKSSYQRTFSLLLNIKRLLRIDVPISGMLGDSGHFHAMVKVERYE
jgi:hypothetical protein